MMVINDLRDKIPLREVSRISGISLSGYYYRPVKRSIQRLDPITKKRIMDIASERPTYGYRRVWAVLRNSGISVNMKTVMKVLKDNSLSLPASKHKGRTNTRNLYKPTGPDQLWETDITCIPTESGMTYLMCIKDCFTKEWQGFHYSRSCMAKDAIRSVENAVLMAFNGSVPEDLVLRTDNGPQYISYEFRNSMNLLGIKLGYIQKHTPEDNGNIESFHSSIKTDYIWPNEFRDFHDASIVIEKAFKDYNEYRPHSSINYLPPREFRRKFLNDSTFRKRYEKKENEVRVNEK
jgi:putative transposase